MQFTVHLYVLIILLKYKLIVKINLNSNKSEK